MWNKSTFNSLGEATLKVTNPLNNEENDVNFVVVPNGFECLLGLKTIRKLDLITTDSEKFIGKIGKDLGDLGRVKLKVDPNASPRALPIHSLKNLKYQ